MNKNNNEKVVAVLGDTHNGNATALIQKNGSLFIRKPRSAEVELAFNAFLSRLKEEGFLYLPSGVNILHNENDMHEVEIVPHSPVENREDFHLYYKRCGALLFFTYLFGSTDLHSENIIACGAYPVIVDYETLFSADFARKDLSSKTVDDTVLGTHLLSIWLRYSDEKENLGGLTGDNAKLPFYKDEKAYACNYIDDILTGFDYAYRFAVNNRQLFKELLGLFDNCLFRTILRPTATYGIIADFVAKLDENQRVPAAKLMLARAYEVDIDKNRLEKAQKVLAAEVKSVSENEIPIFYIRGGGKDIESRHECLWEDYFKNTPIEKASQRLDSLGDSDLEDEKRIIRLSLNASMPLGEKKKNKYDSEHGFEAVYETLENNRINKLPFKWPFLYCDDKGNLSITSCGFGLYNGLLGILCFYATVYHKTRRFDVLKSIEECYADFRKSMLNRQFVLNDGIVSLSTGIGGFFNALCHIYELTGEKMFYSDACDILENITLPKDEPKYHCDVLGGIAGLALALPKIGTDKAKETAAFLAPFLLEFKPELTGAGHGAAGVALALGALGKALETDKFDGRIIQLIEWENQRFDAEKDNWLDLRKTDKNHYAYGWCAGMPGIGMSRKKLIEYTENSKIKALCENDINIVVKSLSRQLRVQKDGLCCGNSALLMACSYLGVRDDAAYSELNDKILGDSLTFNHPVDTCDINHGLMQGIAGAGYAVAMYQDKLCGEMLL